MNDWDSLNLYQITKTGGSWAGEAISIHGEPGRDDYWTDLEREQFESNAKHGTCGNQKAGWSRRIEVHI